MKTSQEITARDVIQAECTLEPMTCIHCGHTGEVTFNQYIGDAHCEWCGEWQLCETD